MKQNFLYTCDEETANKLIAIGFQEVTTGNSNIHTFLNCNKFNFSERDDIDISKIQYGNILTF